jgi:hypothetical protein
MRDVSEPADPPPRGIIFGPSNQPRSSPRVSLANIGRRLSFQASSASPIYLAVLAAVHVDPLINCVTKEIRRADEAVLRVIEIRARTIECRA